MDRQRVLHNPRLLEVLVHAVVWLLIFGFPLALMEYTSFVKWDAMGYLRHLRMPLAFGIVFYVNYMWLVSHLLFKSGWRRFLIYNLLLVVVCFSISRPSGSIAEHRFLLFPVCTMMGA